jgi:hypothetical protein
MRDGLRAWAGELDRSFAEIAEIAADARMFDRLRLNRIADSWDNSIFPFVGAACARWPWAQRAIARDGTEYWNWRSSPAELRRLTPDMAARLAAHFDLSRAGVSALTIERSGGRLECRISIVAHPIVDSYALPDIHITCSGVERMRFDSSDRHGIELSGATGLSIGTGGYVEGSDLTFWVNDQEWLSAGNYRPEPALRSRRWGRPLRGAALEVAELLRAAVLLTRSVWALSMTHFVPVRAFGKVFAGAGTDLLAAGSAVRREDALRRLIERWRTTGGAELAAWFDDPLGTVFPKPDDQPGPAAELMIAGFDVYPEPSTATLIYASPGEPWVLRRVAVENPARFVLDSAAFDCPRAEAESAALVHLEP